MLDAKACHKHWSRLLNNPNSWICWNVFGDFESLEPWVKVTMVPFSVFGEYISANKKQKQFFFVWGTEVICKITSNFVWHKLLIGLGLRISIISLITRTTQRLKEWPFGEKEEKEVQFSTETCGGDITMHPVSFFTNDNNNNNDYFVEQQRVYS